MGRGREGKRERERRTGAQRGSDREGENYMGRRRGESDQVEIGGKTPGLLVGSCKLIPGLLVGWLLLLLLAAGCWLSGSEDLGGGSCGIGMRGRTGFRSSAWMPLLAISAALAIQALAVQAKAVVAAALAPAAAAAAAGADASDDP
jgi:hypothetical protein